MTKHQVRLFDNLNFDFRAAIVVFCVALPLCLGITIFADQLVIPGIFAGIASSVFLGALSGAPSSISCPIAGLAALVLVAIPSFGGFNLLLGAIVLATLIPVVAEWVHIQVAFLR